MADAKFAQMACDDFVPGAKCNTGFLGFWNESKEKAMEGIKAALAEHPDYPIIVTGHSLGGSAAVFAAIELRKQFKDVTLVS
jgi:putative lipase involved disintegration of autophagic bodies